MPPQLVILIQKRRPVGGDQHGPSSCLAQAQERTAADPAMAAPSGALRIMACRVCRAESRLGAHVPAAWPLSA